MKIAHISDIHIRNFRYHDRYKYSFNHLYRSLKENNVDYICMLGDLAHTKENLSAEYFELAANFIKNLSDIAPLIMIMGNHDINLSNQKRQDAITPIYNALESDRIQYLKYSGIAEFGNICFCNLSILDSSEEWNEKVYSRLSEDKINIGMYHGAINGSKTDVGYKLETKINADIFDPFDYTFLGDIHKKQSIGNDDSIWYAGSLIQQDYGEANDKGYFIWDISSKTEYKKEFIKIDDMCPFITYTVRNGKVSYSTLDQDPPQNAYGRFIIEDDLSDAEIQNIISPIITKFLPKEKRIIKKYDKLSAGNNHISDHNINYRDLNIQKRLLNDFCRYKNTSSEVKDKVLEIHEEIYHQISSSVETQDKEKQIRNVMFDINRLEFDNMFSYGTDNYIDFSLLNGVVGIFGPNAIGKSSVVDNILLCAFNNLSRRIPSPAYAVNNRCNYGSIKLTLNSAGTEYTIERDYEWKESDAKDAGDRGKSKTNVKIYKNSEDISSIQRQKTDTVIQSVIGSMEDYVTTSISPQDQIHKFIYMTESPRKDYLINVLDLDFFDQQMEIAKSMAAPIKSKVSNNKRQESDILIDIENNKQSLAKNILDIEEKNKQIEILTTSYDQIMSVLATEEFQLKAIDDKIASHKNNIKSNIIADIEKCNN